MMGLRQSLCLVVLCSALCACGATKFSDASGGVANLQSASDDDGSVNTTGGPAIDDLIDNPVLADDYACGRNKVLICHVPPGNPAAAQTLCISHCAVDQHIREHERDNSHDTLGACPTQPMD